MRVVSSVGVLALGLLTSHPMAGQSVITTLAGTDPVFPLTNIPPTTVALGFLQGATADSAGNVFFTSSTRHVVLRLAPDGTLRVVAGNGKQAFSGEGELATSASLSSPAAVAIARDGNLLIADTDNHRIRAVSADGVISTIAGTGVAGFSGDGGQAISAQFRNPMGIAVDSGGNLYVADVGNNRIRRISADGTITTIAGNGQTGSTGTDGPARSGAINIGLGLAVDASGGVIFAEMDWHRVRRVSPDGFLRLVAGTGRDEFTGDGGPANQASVNQPAGVAFGSDGTLYITDQANRRVRAIAVDGTIRTVAGNGRFGTEGDGGPALSGAFQNPAGIVSVPGRGLFITDSFGARLRRVTPDNRLETVAGNGESRFGGDGGPAIAAILANPQRVAFDAQRNLYFTDTVNNRVRRISAADGTITTIAGNGTLASAADGVPAATAPLALPTDLGFDAAGNLYIVESGASKIRLIRPDGTLMTAAGNGSFAFSGDGGRARDASLSRPLCMTIDPSGSLYIADTLNHRIRKVTGGIITTIAGTGAQGFSGDGGPATSARLFVPQDLVIDAAGNLYVNDAGNSRVRRIGADGIITTVAGTGESAFSGDGGPAARAALHTPKGLEIDRRNGDLYIADSGNNRIRRVRSGIITTIAGTGTAGLAGDGGLATAAVLKQPWGVRFDPSGNLIISDTFNDRIRVILAETPVVQVSRRTVTLSAPSRSALSTSESVSVGSSVAGGPFRVSKAGGDWLNVTPDQGAFPAELRFSADASNLDPGRYPATVTVTSPVSAQALIISVELTVAPPVQGRFVATTDRVYASLPKGSGAVVKQVGLSLEGSGSVAYTAATTTESGGNWLSVVQNSGNVLAGVPAFAEITIDPAGLEAGTWSGSIVLTPAFGDAITIPVILIVNESRRRILLSQSGLTFTAVAGGSAPSSQTVGVINSGEGSMRWQMRASTLSGGSWLSASSSAAVSEAGAAPPLVAVSVNPSGLQPGEYFGKVEIESPDADNSPHLISIFLNVLIAGSNPGPEVRPSGLIFTGAPGSSPGSQDIFLSIPGLARVQYTSSRFSADGVPWFEHAPSNGAVEPPAGTRVAVYPDFTNLTTGAHRGTLTFQFQDGSVRTVNLLAIVSPSLANASKGIHAADGCTPRRLLIQPTTLREGFSVLSLQPSTVQVRVVDDCSQPVTRNAVVTAAFSNLDPNVNLTHTGSGVWSASWQPRNSSVSGVKITITAFASVVGVQVVGEQVTLSGTLRSGSRAPVVAGGSLKNAASFATEVAVAPGGLVSVFGSNLADGETAVQSGVLPRELGGTTVMLGGRPLALSYASAGQINAQLPSDLNTDTQHQIFVQRGDAISVPDDVVVAPARPAIFSKHQTGRGQGVILKEDGSYAEAASPAVRGEVVRLFCAGLGKTDPPVAQGEPAPGPNRTTNPVVVTIGGIPAEVRSAGLSTSLPGVYEVLVVVPAESEESDEVPVIVSVGGQASPPVTMAVR